ncbi:hypothetical protein JR316_0008548 [Psilocybe cubensis]|uniref:Uncharacterized protein n=2 Tax=Psilocybe cubensis TaxID=181762 RepID=A0ACB8GXJ0_PSICU|nr:hypothetical protein JR316_0008548 [Psilocybe cubensis]KAH9479951.1 hypothetical protein JR316_0008548 [Psilocybe cubensis]
MISDTQTSITSSDPHFPSEITDLIFDFALPGLDPRSISSVAHASHHFRALANHQRFSSISFVYNDTKRIPTNVKMRICKFAELIQTGRQITTMRGIQTFISSFTLEVGIGSDFLNFTKLGYLSVIFDNLFRDPAITCEPVRMLSLNIAPDQPFRDWKKDGNTLLESLWSLIRTPYLNELRILRGSGIPLNLILGSNIENLHVGDLVMFDDEIVELKQVSRPVELKSLWLDVWPDSDLENYLQLICDTSDPPPERFSDLTDLVVYNGSNVFISRILGLTKSLKTLTLGHRYNPSQCNS